MIVEEVTSLDGLVKLEPEWRRLQIEVGTLPFTSWEWNITWWRHLARRSLATSDRLLVHAFRDPDGTLAAVAPLMLTEQPARGPRLRCLRYFGADPNITEIRGPLCRVDRLVEMHEALLAHLARRRDAWDLAILEGIPADSGVVSLLELRGTPHWIGDTPDFVLPLAKSWEEFRSSRSRNIKESLRKCTNSLKRDGLVPEYRVITQGPALQRALDVFVELHAARAARTDTVRHRDLFGGDAPAAFLRELSDRFSARGDLRVFTMEVRGETVAARLALLAGRSLYLYYSGYDLEFGKYSVMTSVVAEAMKYAIAQGLESVNLSTGEDVSKTRWSPDMVVYRQVVFPSEHAKLATAGYVRLREVWRALRAKAIQYAHDSERSLTSALLTGRNREG